ncbi:uncharacterized protein [Drosophila kikkawai]|uniref:Uncharacterized protein n=1 Tax=Drosophila kikkawai TaxID=30033 RepID=A0A6P4ILH9_DROKI|nr:uncharacterized protein LOC108075593 isoform X2 [Drosophila kikkawai]
MEHVLHKSLTQDKRRGETSTRNRFDNEKALWATRKRLRWREWPGIAATDGDASPRKEGPSEPRPRRFFEKGQSQSMSPNMGTKNLPVPDGASRNGLTGWLDDGSDPGCYEARWKPFSSLFYKYILSRTSAVGNS